LPGHRPRRVRLRGGPLPAAERGAMRDGEGSHDEVTVVCDFLDAVELAVDRAAPVAGVPGQFPGQAAALDDVADPGDRAVLAERDAVLGDAADRDELGA